MRKYRTFIIAAACLAALAAIVARVLPDKEPRYQGHRLTYWLAHYIHDDGNAERIAADAIRHIGTNALPHLLRRIQYEDSPRPLKEHLTELLDKAPESLVPEFLADWADSDPQEDRANEAPDAFAVLGALAEPAVPDLLRLMNDPQRPSTARRALDCLAGVGKPAIPHILAILQSPSSPLRVHALSLVGDKSISETNADPLIPALLTCLNDTNRIIKAVAIRSLGQCRRHSSLVVPALTEQLQIAPDPILCQRSLMALAALGSEARAAEPAIVPFLTHTNLLTRKLATNALHVINPASYPDPGSQTFIRLGSY